MKVSVHPGADQDLSDAFRFYGGEAGAGVARRFLGAFERAARLLNEFPDLDTLTGGDRRTYPHPLLFVLKDRIRILAGARFLAVPWAAT